MEQKYVVVCGDVGAGKSTLLGHLIWLTGGIDELTRKRYEEQSAALGKASYRHAWVMDRTDEERTRGTTLYWSRFPVKLLDGFTFNLINVPSHPAMVGQLIAGMSQATTAILVVDARPGKFEAGMAEDGQTLRHALLLKALGVHELIVCVNWMDAVNYSQERFNTIAAELKGMLRKVGFPEDQCPIIPTSAWYGDNLVKRSTRMPWYSSSSYPLYDALVAKRSNPLITNANKPLRATVTRTDNQFSLGEYGRDMLSAHIEQGLLRRGDHVIFYPAEDNHSPGGGEIYELEVNGWGIPEGYPGLSVEFKVQGLERAKWPQLGAVMGDASDSTLGNVERFTAQIIVNTHAGEIKVGYTPMLYLNSAQVPVRLVAIEHKLDPLTGSSVAENPSALAQGDHAIAVFEPQAPLTLGVFRVCPGLGRLVLMDGEHNAQGVTNLTFGTVLSRENAE